MPRALRVEDEGAACHVMCRGDRQEAIFRGDTDRERFLEVLDLAGRDVSELRKLDVRKQVLAWWVHKQTVVGNRWIVNRLEMGDEGTISKVIRAVSRSRSPTVRRLKNLLMKEDKIPRSGD